MQRYYSWQLGGEAVSLVNENLERLIEQLIEVLTEKQEAIVADVWKRNSYPSDLQTFSGKTKKQWEQWVNQVSVIDFNSGKYNLNIVNKYFAKEINFKNGHDCDEGVLAAKESNYIFLTTSKFIFLIIKNYIRTGLNYDAWSNSTSCKLQKLMFPYEYLDRYESLSHLRPVGYEDLYRSLKTTIAKGEYEHFLKMFEANDCATHAIYKVAEVVSFIGDFIKTAKQYYRDKIDVYKNLVSIPGISMTCAMKKSLEKDKKLE